MIVFKFRTDESIYSDARTEVTLKTNAATWPDVFESFVDFLNGIGYSVTTQEIAAAYYEFEDEPENAE